MTKIIAIGDVYVKPETFVKYVKDLNLNDDLIIKTYKWGSDNKDEFRVRANNIEANGPLAESYPLEIEDEIKDTDIILTHMCPIPRVLIEKANSLKLIGASRGGTENIDLIASSERKIPVIHSIRNAEPVADFTLGLMLSETRNISRSHSALKQGVWLKEFPNSEFTTVLAEHKVGLVGLGYIGKLVANKLIALGVTVYGYDPYVTQEQLNEKGLKIVKKNLDEIFSECDIISLHVRLTSKTENLINKRNISLMKRNAYLINTSRAGLINSEDLYQALNEKRIAGAALDVFWDEPLAENDLFLTLPNVTLTPHIAGDTIDAIPESPKLLVKNINDYLVNGVRDMVVNKY